MDRRTRGERFVNRRSLRFTGRRHRRGVYRLLRMRRCIAGSQVYASDSEYQGSIFEPGGTVSTDISISSVHIIWRLSDEFNLRGREAYLESIELWRSCYTFETHQIAETC